MKGLVFAKSPFFYFIKMFIPTGQSSLPPWTRVPFRSLLDEILVCPWLPKMTLLWKQMLLLSIIDRLAGKPPFYMSNDSFMFGHLQLWDDSWRADNHVSVRPDRAAQVKGTIRSIDFLAQDTQWLNQLLHRTQRRSPASCWYWMTHVKENIINIDDHICCDVHTTIYQN